MGDSQYSFSLTTFSPSGKLVQIEHALTAVGSGQTSLGIKAANGVVIATEKKLPSILVDETSVQKIQTLTPNIGVVYSGMGPDSRVLVRKSRKQAEQYYRLYKEPIPVTQLVRETAAVMQEFTQSGGVRPFGVSLLVAGYDDKGPQLYQVDPSGSYFSWKASAMGKNVSNAKTFLEKSQSEVAFMFTGEFLLAFKIDIQVSARYTEELELDDAVHTAILTLKEGTAEKTNIPWTEMTKEILNSDVYKELESIENPAIVYPDYYLNPFHAYDEGNLSWLAAAEADAATMSMVRRAIPNASSLDEANQIVRGNWLDAIEKHHQQYSADFSIRDILDIGCSVGVSTGYLADRFPSAKVTFHECPERAIRNIVKESFRLLRPGGTVAITDNSPKSKILQELPPVLFTLMKSTEPFLDEYYLTDLERVIKETGFANVQTVLTDPRHRTVTATVPY
uniref:Proteasome alpha-type subunits domain-containing protein n=1 Tax=Solanum lycopersicum TaxID=4081 RepID=A0A3Q7IB13_SOLLC